MFEFCLSFNEHIKEQSKKYVEENKSLTLNDGKYTEQDIESAYLNGAVEAISFYSINIDKSIEKVK